LLTCASDSADEEKHHEAGLQKGLTPEGDAHAPIYTNALDSDYDGKPSEEEMATLRRVPGGMPRVAYLLCLVEFCERASFYGCQGLFSNYVNRPLPLNGNGYGSPPPGTQQTPGALGMGQAKANAVVQSFNLLAYLLPLFTGYIADTRTGRYKMIVWGIYVMGVGHVILVASGAKSLLNNGQALGPFFVGIYIIALGAGTS
jgi:dipeptide/tripeptide permease